MQRTGVPPATAVPQPRWALALEELDRVRKDVDFGRGAGLHPHAAPPDSWMGPNTRRCHPQSEANRGQFSRNLAW